jgi:hypothetical protein
MRKDNQQFEDAIKAIKREGEKYLRNRDKGKILAVILAVMLILACMPAGLALASAPSLTISPNGGTITTSETVGLNATLSVGQAVYYTITSGSAGTTPTVASTVYTAPFIVSSSAGRFTVEAAVYDGSTLLWSSPASATFTVWGIAPHGGAITTSETVGINATPTVDQAVYYTITSGSAGTTPTVASTVYSAPFIVSSSVGTFTVEAAVYADSTGWISTDSATFTLSYPSSSGGGGGGSSATYYPLIQTDAATSVTATSAVLNGDITSDNGYAVTDYGFLWGTSSSSITNKLDVGDTNQSGAFTDTLSSLTAGTTYYFQAYATNSYGTADGAVMSFNSFWPVVQTEAATSVTATSAVLNGDVTLNNGYTVTDSGFLWGTSASSLPNTLDAGTAINNGAFTETLSSLTAGTTYYFEAYATNSYGTADGSVLSFTAGAQTLTPIVQTEAASSVTDTSAILNGDVTSNNGYTVTDYGFLWGTSDSSLTNKLDVGDTNQSGAFTDTLNSLTAGTTYYFEAYANNSYGTADGSVLSFTAGVQTPTTSTGTVFSDVPSSYWGYNIITSLSSRGIVNGYNDGTFKPNAAITRAEFTVMLAKALGLNINGTTSTFSDVIQGSWLYGSVNAAVTAGLVTGLGNNQFGPYTLITRQQMAVMVAKGLGSNTPTVNGTELNAFNDRSHVSSWATTGVDEAVKSGVVIGMSADRLAPLAHATRAQAAAMIYQLLSVLGK